MRKILFICFMFAFQSIFAQTKGVHDFTLTVKDNTGKGLANTDIDLVETETHKIMTQKTDANGTVKFEIKEGKYWQINVLKVRNYYQWQIEFLKNGGTQTKSITYDYKNYLRETRPVVNRSKLQLKTENQSFSDSEKPKDDLSVAKLYVSKADKSPLANFELALTCYALNTTFQSKTDANGLAVFKIPMNNEYQIDIDGIDNFKYIDMPNTKGWTATMKFTYEPTVIQEVNKNDSITQTLPANATGTSGRVLVKLRLKDRDGSLFLNEPVYLSEIKGKKVYLGNTGQTGEMFFLLPKGKKYMIHARYEKDLDVFDLTRSVGIGNMSKGVRYRPLEALQYPDRFIPRPDQLFLKHFSEFLTKHLAQPDPNETLKIYAKFANQINAESKQAVLDLNFTFEQYDMPTNQNYTEAPPVNISLVIDKSGSMAGEDRIESLREALGYFVKKLRSEDIVSIVTFNEQKSLLSPASKIGNDRIELYEEVLRIEAGGGTDMYDAMIEGYTQVAKNYKKGKVNRMILMTDGYDSNPVEKVVNKSKEFNAKGIDCSVVGIGEGYNVALLKLLATQGGGLTSFIRSSQGFKNMLNKEMAFAKDLGALIQPIAKDITVEVSYNSQLLFAHLYGFTVESQSEGKINFRLENAFSGINEQLAMIKFTLVNPSQEIENQPVTIKTKYYDTRKKQIVEKTETAILGWSKASGEVEFQMEAEQKKLYAMAIMNQSLKVMADAFVAKDNKKAIETLQNTIADVQKLFPKATDQEVADLLKSMIGYLDILVKLR